MNSSPARNCHGRDRKRATKKTLSRFPSSQRRLVRAFPDGGISQINMKMPQRHLLVAKVSLAGRVDFGQIIIIGGERLWALVRL